MSFLKSMIDFIRLHREKNKKIVFYSEGGSYWINFRDIINSLIDDHNQVVYYVTSSESDPALQRASDYFKPFYIGNEFFRILFFQTLKAEMFLTTLPDIDTFHLKRSRSVKIFIYIHHTLGSSNMVFLPHAFDSYDVIMCAGPHQIAEAEEMEEFYHSRPKKLIHAGYPPLDDLLRRLEGYGIQSNPTPVITIAPSWQPDNIIDRVACPLIDSLLSAGLVVKLRPHPRTLAMEKDKVDEIVAHYEENDRFSLDNNPGSFDSYLGTDLLVTDWSGTGFKFAFALLRPVLFINTPPKARNTDYCKFKNMPVEFMWRDKVGKALDENEMQSAGSVAKALLQDYSWSQRLADFRKNNVFHLCDGGVTTASAIMTLLGDIGKEA